MLPESLKENVGQQPVILSSVCMDVSSYTKLCPYVSTCKAGLVAYCMGTLPNLVAKLKPAAARHRQLVSMSTCYGATLLLLLQGGY